MDYSNSNSGGYMNSSYNDSNNNDGAYARKPMGDQTLRPVTIKQIKTCTMPQEGVFRIDNADASQITFVGVIRNIQELATNYVYTIEDGTGAIEVRKWIEQQESPEEADARRELTIDTYVRVNGRLNSFSGRISIVGYSIRPVTDFNEITYHLLDTIHTHLVFTKTGSDNTMNVDPIMKPLTIQDHVNDAIKMFDNNPDGATIEQICSKLKNLYTETQIRETIDILQSEGQCYNTIDDNHIKSCLP
ncbi:uncharacterized protein BX663DRAFT_512929 [Cokeromyces recurvatus]|uniref:uncharacterized protein n=1 Tax=Cokeromyces recurvatus TaxID=90255 RepID=UPI00221E5E82|nr:uncharacterized protein BX663DRAFT_512929 [Cokeromyces recurvatus]KAI7901927.1 hypothetical protein BX663DRAFT_512929 [Cokeromyces recurvatus]